ncbi:cyclic beta 1-2 glucan synthetase, partial [Candidatus Sumerlaeota bacterium]|nr:cyclic beta 1-2 glucan synthetase [Candidatus Sumerlaeota bacterium]
DRGVPWGMSESGYNATDSSLNYQYRAFGVPGLGLKRGLADDLVVSPYATVMALMIRPEAGCKNLERLTREGAEGRYGYYEAVDYTAARLSPGEKKSIVQSFMAHHQGISLLSLLSVLLDKPMQRRFQSDPMFQATELLLQERIPRAAPIFPHAAELSAAHRANDEAEPAVRIYANPDMPSPEVHLLSNGRYSVMITNAGGGYSRWKDLALTRWNEDATRDHWGMFCYVRDVTTGKFWSSTHQPTLKSAKHFEAIFPLARAEFRCSKREIETHTEIAVSPEDDIELRRVSVTNRSEIVRTLELTSYAEVALAPPDADASHPAFSKLFVETEIIRAKQTILCTRRPRSKGEKQPWMIHLMSLTGTVSGEPSYETDRLRFLGRGRTSADPQAMYGMAPLSGSEGAVLDPIVAIRRTITLGPGATAVVDIVTGASGTREGAMALMEKYHDRALGDRVFDLAWTHGQVLLRQLNASDADAQIYERLAGSLLFPSPLRRANSGVLLRNRRQQSALWGYGISGDLPIVVLRISDPSRIELVRELIQAHAFWRLKGLSVDLVILNEDHSGYRQLLHDEITGLIASGSEAGTTDRPGGIFVRRNDQIPEEDRILIETVARAIFVDNAGTLAEQTDRRGRIGSTPPAFIPIERRGRGDAVPRLFPPRHSIPPALPIVSCRDTDALRRELICFNGLGGFTRDGREYVIHLTPGLMTPMPWANVLANPSFGAVVTESGGGYTWSENAHEFRLTPWHNDPVSDTSGEAIYIRDEETGRFWSPTPLPARGSMPYTARHGFGYSVFEYTENGVTSELWVYVATDAAIKISALKIRNHSGRWRRFSATGFVEWTLGKLRSKSVMHVHTEIDPECGALFARNFYNNEFPDRVAFFDVSESSRTYTGDRTEFLGRNGSFGNPAAMSRARLSGKVGAGLDPCAAMQVQFDLADGQ